MINIIYITIIVVVINVGELPIFRLKNRNTHPLYHFNLCALSTESFFPYFVCLITEMSLLGLEHAYSPPHPFHPFHPLCIIKSNMIFV